MNLEIITEGECRNEDIGDWCELFGGAICLRTAPLPVESHCAVAIHEWIEILRCNKAGITDEQVTKFDAEFLAAQKAGTKSLLLEAGHDPDCPYREHHEAAERVERGVIEALGLTWDQHCDNCEQAYQTASRER